MRDTIIRVAIYGVFLTLIGGCTYLVIDDNIRNPTVERVENVGTVERILSSVSNTNFWGVTTTYTLGLGGGREIVLDRWEGPIKTGDRIKLKQTFKGDELMNTKYIIER